MKSRLETWPAWTRRGGPSSSWRRHSTCPGSESHRPPALMPPRHHVSGCLHASRCLPESLACSCAAALQPGVPGGGCTVGLHLGTETSAAHQERSQAQHRMCSCQLAADQALAVCRQLQAPSFPQQMGFARRHPAQYTPEARVRPRTAMAAPGYTGELSPGMHMPVIPVER